MGFVRQLKRSQTRGQRKTQRKRIARELRKKALEREANAKAQKGRDAQFAKYAPRAPEHLRARMNGDAIVIERVPRYLETAATA
jgi:hypothetical protein